MSAYLLRNQYLIFLMLSCFFISCGNDRKQDKGKTAPVETGNSAESSRTEKPGALKNILFFGTSLTAGLGVDPDQAFPAGIQQRIDSLHLPYKVINAGLSGETSAAGKGRIDWLLRQKVEIFVLELGANDGLRGLPVNTTEANLQYIIDQVKKKYPEAKLVLAGMQMPPSMGQAYTRSFKKIYPDLAARNQMELIPFLLQGVGGISQLNQKDGIHPNAAGHRILAENVWEKLEGLL